MWATILALSSLIIGSIGLTVGICALIKVMAMEKSTHQVQWVPVDQSEAINPKELEKKLRQPEVEWEEDELI